MNIDKNYDKYFEEIGKTEVLFTKILKLYHSNSPKPNNLEDEKRIFFSKIKKNQKYNPQIGYTLKKYFLRDFYLLRFKLSYLIHIEENDKDELGIKTLYKKKLSELNDKINYHDLWGEKKSTKFILNTYGKPSFITLMRAKWFCKFSKIYKYDKSFELSDKINHSRVLNATKTHIKLFKVGTAGSYETRVGLEIYDKFVAGKLSDEELYFYAGMFIASYYTLRKDFYKVFKILKKYKFTDDEAFDMTYNVKKNLFDTSLRGGYVKSGLVYSGFLKVKKYTIKNDVDNLMFGYVGIDDLKILKNYISTINKK
jgi:hypothetical protein